MSQCHELLWLFQRYGYRLTLGQILQTNLAAEYRSRMWDLRQEGYVIIYHRGKTPSEGVYIMRPPDENGQCQLAI